MSRKVSLKKLNFREQFIIAAGSKVDFDKLDPDFTKRLKGEKQDIKVWAKEKTAANLKRIGQLQQHLYDSGRKESFLFVFEAMDGGGKDSTINRLRCAISPQGTKITSFKGLTAEERKHDYDWRIRRAISDQPSIVNLFNRSHYGDIIFPKLTLGQPESVWGPRFDKNNALEKEWSEDPENRKHILKFFLHISNEEQLERFWDRLNDPEKYKKFAADDFEKRARWDEFMELYEEILTRCWSTPYAPGFVIPSNHKWMRDLIISEIVLDLMEGLCIPPPKPEVEIHGEMVNIEEVKKRYFPDGPPKGP